MVLLVFDHGAAHPAKRHVSDRQQCCLFCAAVRVKHVLSARSPAGLVSDSRLHKSNHLASGPIPLCHAEIHIILDNLSAHKTQRVAEFLKRHPDVTLHFTPTYSSWLNQVELWFSKLQRDVIARGVFTSVADLARKLRRYINAYSKHAKPFRWKYSQPSRRIRHA